MMNSASESRSSLSQKPSSAAHSSRNPSSSSRPSQPTDSSSSSSPRGLPSTLAARKENGGSAVNGHDSDAETDILSDQDKPKGKQQPKKRTSQGSSDRQRSSPSLNVKSEPLNSHPPSRRSSMNGGAPKDVKRVNGIDRKDGESKKPTNVKLRSVEKATPSSSRAQSAEASLSVASSAPSETAYDSTGRTRQSQSVEPKKRKHSEDQKSKLEPPRQRPRLDSSASKSKRLSSPGSNPPASAGHRRSTSNQSGIARSLLRKKRDASAHSQQSDDRSKWADDSSEDSSTSPPPTRKDRSTIPHLAPPKSRAALAQRALTSPARTNALHSRRADKYGTTPLAKACEKGQLDAVKKAYEQAPEELNQEDNGGFTPLQKASLGGHFEVVRFLLNKGCRRDCYSKEERDTPLIDAVENGHYKVVKILLDSGVNPHHQNKKGVRAIDAVDHDEDNADLIEAALKKAMAEYQGAEDDHEDAVVQESPAAQIRSKGGGGLRPDLLYQALTLDNLYKYSTSGDLEGMGMVLESVQPNVACAVAAARGGHEAALSLLLASAQIMEKDPSPIKYEETPMLAAIGRGHLRIIELLLNVDNFNPCRKTRDGKTYYELAAERHGPRWQAEYELLKARYDAFKENAGKRREGKSIKTPTKDSSPKSPRLLKKPLVSTATEELKEKKQKRHSTGNAKESSSSKEYSRKRRVVDEDSSEDISDKEQTVGSRRRNQGSSGSKVPKKTSSSTPGHTDETPISQPSSPRAKFSRKPQVKREEVDVDGDVDNEITMDDAPTINTKAEKLARRQSRVEAAEIKAREDAEAQLKAEAEAREKEEQEAREREEAAKRQLELEEAARQREEFLSSMPLMLRLALERGLERPVVSFKSETPVSTNVPSSWLQEPHRVLGIKSAFLPLYSVKWKDFDWDLQEESKMEVDHILSHQVVGILGLPDLDVRTIYPHWETLPVTAQQMQLYMKALNPSKLLMEVQWKIGGPMGCTFETSLAAERQCKEQMVALHDKLQWVKLDDFMQAFEDLKKTDAGKKLEQLGELAIVRAPNLKRTRGTMAYLNWKPHPLVSKPPQMRSGAGSVYEPRKNGEPSLFDGRGSASPASSHAEPIVNGNSAPYSPILDAAPSSSTLENEAKDMMIKY